MICRSQHYTDYCLFVPRCFAEYHSLPHARIQPIREPLGFRRDQLEICEHSVIPTPPRSDVSLRKSSIACDDRIGLAFLRLTFLLSLTHLTDCSLLISHKPVHCLLRMACIRVVIHPPVHRRNKRSVHLTVALLPTSTYIA